YFDATSFGSGFDYPIKCLIIGGSAIRVAGTVLLDRTNIYLRRAQHFRPTDRCRQEMGIAKGNVSDRNIAADQVGLRHRDVRVCERGSTYLPEGIVLDNQSLPDS